YTVQRFQKASKHWRTREEEQQIADARKQRGRPQRKRRGTTEADDDGFEKIRRRERVLVNDRRQPQLTPNTAQTDGTVVSLTRGRAVVRTTDGERRARLAPELARTQQTSVAVGDEVTLLEQQDADPIVASVAPRRSELARTDPANPERRRVLAANVDLVALVLTADRPRTALVDRLRAALSDSGARLVVVVNKADLEHDRAGIEMALRPHRAEEIPIVFASAIRGDGLDELEVLIRARTVAFAGHSGVGKSTLLNRLAPPADGDAARATGAVRAQDGRGRHTTTASRLTALDDGTRLIDTPGVRAFGLPEGTTDAAAAFPDVLAFAERCRFRDCAHDAEPGCAVRAAVDEGELDADRLASYRRLTNGSVSTEPGQNPT
ncbi:MAG: ribosome small subunit-dependent GTPase A, partial [Planctomycetes bacterium]|nr:ribosome small subunit-dependent GTPase A [Planctomycetota bacterium]